MQTYPGLEIAIFAAGCFWDVEAAFRKIDGVVGTETGYTGGTIPDPDFELVRSATTGHVEAVRVAFDPAVVNYDELLEVFWNIQDPTEPAEEACELSAIFFSTEEQQRTAESSRNRLQASGGYGNRPVITKILPASRFWRAEDHHQQFFEKCGRSYVAAGKYWD
ncbi:MAG: peptide-methionine (S)-S-oxide reductase MsrA [Methanoregulaceae archaeon]